MAETDRQFALADDGASRAASQLRFRARGVHDLDILRALDLVARERFVGSEHAALARRDILLPTPHGSSVPEAWLLGRMAAALAPKRSDRVLEIGTGSGYATAVLAQIAGHVVSVERTPAAAADARARLDRLGVTNATIVRADLARLPRDLGRFSHVLVHGCRGGPLREIEPHLASGAIVVTGRTVAHEATRRLLVRMVLGPGGDWREDVVCPCRLPILPE